LTPKNIFAITKISRYLIASVIKKIPSALNPSYYNLLYCILCSDITPQFWLKTSDEPLSIVFKLIYYSTVFKKILKVNNRIVCLQH